MCVCEDPPSPMSNQRRTPPPRRPFHWTLFKQHTHSVQHSHALSDLMSLCLPGLKRHHSTTTEPVTKSRAPPHIENHQSTVKHDSNANDFTKHDPIFPPLGYRPTPVNTLLANALDLTAPASDALLKNRKNAWVQLAGHPGSFAPAGPHTIWKKRLTKENNETVAYQSLMSDEVRPIVPRFYREVEYNGDFFIEIEDLLQHFQNPSIMDIKMGTRTFLELEVKNPVLRTDLYEKMKKLDPNQPTPEEHLNKAITKLRYMQFREKGSSTSLLGFRIEAIRMSNEPSNTELKKIKTKEEVKTALCRFLNHNHKVQEQLLRRLKEMHQKFEASNFFKNHEIIGSSILIMYDHTGKVNAWMIDFAKTLPVNDDLCPLTHKTPWEVGNHEDGYLFGLKSLIELISEINCEETAQCEKHFQTISVDTHEPELTEKT